MTLTIDARDLPAHVGRSLGTGRWLALQRHDVDGFAELTGDLQWGHIDVERAGRRPFGSPIVHGCFTLSLLPKLSIEIYGVTGFGVGLNYGLNRVRFPAPLPVGGEFRLGVELHEVRSVPGGGVEYITRNTFELRGSSKPVCMADWIVRGYP